MRSSHYREQIFASMRETRLNEFHGQTVIDEWQPILHFPLEHVKETEVESLGDLSHMRRESEYFNVMFPQSCENLRFRMNGTIIPQQNR
jgi:hypothetical protein